MKLFLNNIKKIRVSCDLKCKFKPEVFDSNMFCRTAQRHQLNMDSKALTLRLGVVVTKETAR